MAYPAALIEAHNPELPTSSSTSPSPSHLCNPRPLKRLVVPLITCFLVVMFGSLRDPHFLLTHEGRNVLNFSVPIAQSRGESVREATLRCHDFGLSGTTFMAADFGDSRVFACPQFDLHPCDNVAVATIVSTCRGLLAAWDDIIGSAAEVPCAAAHFLLTTFTARLMPQGESWSLPSSSEVDWGRPESGLVSVTSASSDLAAWEIGLSLILQTEKALAAAFRALPASDPHYKYLRECGSRIIVGQKPTFEDVPPHLRSLGDPIHDKRTVFLPFTNRFTPTPTARLPRAHQLRDTLYRPMSFLHILDASAVDEIINWIHIESSNMAAIKSFGSSVRRVRNAVDTLGFGIAVQPHDVLVIGQDQFLPAARDIIWDCRGFEFGLPAIPMDFDGPIISQLNSEFIQQELSDWPDQEMVGMLLDGVQFKAKLELQIVLGPHLTSLENAYGNVEKEILRLTSHGFNSLHRVLPFAPIRAVPQGSTPRKLEPGRDRRTSDGGFPRKRTLDLAGNFSRFPQRGNIS